MTMIRNIGAALARLWKLQDDRGISKSPPMWHVAKVNKMIKELESADRFVPPAPAPRKAAPQAVVVAPAPTMVAVDNSAAVLAQLTASNARLAQIERLLAKQAAALPPAPKAEPQLSRKDCEVLAIEAFGESHLTVSRMSDSDLLKCCTTKIAEAENDAPLHGWDRALRGLRRERLNAARRKLKTTK